MIRLRIVRGGENGELWHWVARAENGRILCSSEVFASKGNARKARDRFCKYLLPLRIQIEADEL